MDKWVLIKKGGDFTAIGRRYHISPILARLIRNRDIVTHEDYREYIFGDDGVRKTFGRTSLYGMDRAVRMLAESIRTGTRVRIVGDYDIDGVVATCILYRGIAQLGGNVDYDVPDRVHDGYGINQRIILKASEEGVGLIITCDNGIAAFDEMVLASRLGIKTIITDHHEVPFDEEEGEKKYRIPDADAVINPKHPRCEGAFTGLCGAAVAYQVIEAVYHYVGKDVRLIEPFVEEVAVATVGDVMALRGDNRLYVKRGLEYLKHPLNQGMKSLMEVCGVDFSSVNTYHIGFLIGPCLNAGGRISTAKKAIRLLCTEDRDEARNLAEELKDLNDTRKTMTNDAVAEGIKQAQELVNRQKILVIFLPECHESIAGIVAGRIKDFFHRPTIVLTKGGEGLKGSGRSIEDYSMYEEIDKCRELLTRYGGHKMAAGLSLPEENLESFSQKINGLCALKDSDFSRKIRIDMELPLKCFTTELVRELEIMEPYGVGNEKPLFAVRDVKVENIGIFGQHRKVVRGRLRDKEGSVKDMVMFGQEEAFQKAVVSNHGRMTVAFTPGINAYNGRESVQLVVKHFKD